MVQRWFPSAFNSSYLRGSDHSHDRRGFGGGLRNGDSTNPSANSNSNSNSSSSNPTNKFYFDALGRGPGREAATHKTTVRSEPRVRGRGGDDSLEEIEFGAIRDKNGETRRMGLEESQRGIQVVTVVEQEVEKGFGVAGSGGGGGYASGGGGGGGGDAKSEAGSERELVSRGGLGRFG